MKTSTKVIGSFSLALLMVGLVGVVGYYSISSLTTEITELGENRLPAMDALNNIRVAAEQIKVVQRTLLNMNNDATVRQRQFDNLAKARANYAKAIDAYESLPRTPEETQAWNEFKPTLQQWRTDNGPFFQMMEELGKLDLGNVDALREKIALFRGDHYRLRMQVLDMLRTKKVFDGGEDHTKCNFGHWKESYKASNPDLAAHLKNTDQPHEAFHAAVKRAKQLVGEGNLAAAEKLYDEQIQASADKTLAQLTAMMDLTGKPQELARKAETYSVTTARDSQEKAMKALDRVEEASIAATDQKVQTAERQSSWANWTIVIATVLGGAIFVTVGYFVARSITRVLRTTIEETQRLSEAAVHGHLEARGNPESVSAEFRPIVDGVNATLDSLVTIIDRIPSPVMVIGKEFEIRYMNDAGANVIGLGKKELVGTKCHEHFKTPHCQTRDCACSRAMSENQMVTAETQAHPGGHNLEIAYSGIPIRDRQGSVVGAFELVTDMTAVKSAERIARKVADYQNAETAKLAKNLERCANGDLAVSVEIAAGDADTAEARKAFTVIGSAMDKTLGAIRSLAADVKSLGGAAASGQLDTRADEAKYQGEYRKEMSRFSVSTYFVAA